MDRNVTERSEWNYSQQIFPSFVRPRKDAADETLLILFEATFMVFDRIMPR